MRKAGWLPKALVGFSVLLVLGAGGYAGQVWWARQVAKRWAAVFAAPEASAELTEPLRLNRRLANVIASWRTFSHVGAYASVGYPGNGWVPRRTWHELLRLWTGQDLPNDPDAWEAWFKAHPNLVWDEKQKRLVDSQNP